MCYEPFMILSSFYGKFWHVNCFYMVRVFSVFVCTRLFIQGLHP